MDPKLLKAKEYLDSRGINRANPQCEHTYTDTHGIKWTKTRRHHVTKQLKNKGHN